MTTLEYLPALMCLESEWTGRFGDGLTVRPLVQLLEATGSTRGSHFRTVATVSEFDFHVGRWLEEDFWASPIAYLATHGFSGGISLSEGVHLTMEELAARIDGRGGGRMLYFGSCGVMAAGDDLLADFCRETGIGAVVGYKADVDWIESAACDLLLLSTFLSLTQNPTGARFDDARRFGPTMRRVAREHPGFIDRFGLSLVTARGAARASE